MLEMNIVESQNYSLINEKFNKEIKKFPIINAIVHSRIRGVIYSDKNFTNLFICSDFGWSLLVINSTENYEMIFDFLKNNYQIPDYVHIYSPDESYIDYIRHNWNKIKVRRRIQLEKNNTFLLPFNGDTLPEGYLVVRVQDVKFSKLNVFNLGLSNRYWKSKSDFQKNAIGFCIVDSFRNPIAICYSICIVDKTAEVDILVLPKYSGQNFGFLVSIMFLNALSLEGLTAHWDTFLDNKASLNLAKKLKFEEKRDYNLVSIFLRDW
jgi:hypothetical protein